MLKNRRKKSTTQMKNMNRSKLKLYQKKVNLNLYKFLSTVGGFYIKAGFHILIGISKMKRDESLQNSDIWNDYFVPFFFSFKQRISTERHKNIFLV